MQKGVYLIVYLCTIWVPVALEVKSGHQTPLKLELYTVRDATWILGFGPRSSGRAAATSVLNVEPSL